MDEVEQGPVVATVDGSVAPPVRTDEAQRRTRATTWGGASDRVAVQLIAEDVARRAGFTVCAVEVLRGDNMLEFVAIHGSPDGAARLLGQGSPLEAMSPAFNCGADFGVFTFVATEWMTDEAFAQLREYGHVPVYDPGEAPDAWHPEDMLAARLRDDRGRLRAILYLDEPLTGRRLSTEELERLSTDLALPLRALVTTVEREEFAQQFRLATAAREVVRRASSQLPLVELLELAKEQLGVGFRAADLHIEVFGEAHTERVVLAEDATAEVFEAIEAAAQDVWGTDRVALFEAGQVWGADELAPEHARTLLEAIEKFRVGTLVVVPVGAVGQLLGALVICRGVDDARWSDSEGQAALDVGQDLGRAVLNARAFEREARVIRELKGLDRYRAELISTISHELKNPLTIITAHLEMIESTPDLPASVARSLEAMERGAGRLAALTENLLELSRLGQLDSPAVLEEVDVSALVAEAVELAQAEAAAASVDLAVLAPAPGVVLADPDELQRVAVNLVGNALKYSDPGGTVRVTVATEGDEVVLTVADQGLGISEQDRERLFTEFFRSTNLDALRRPGTGLGLAIVHRVVERHRGRIEVESELGVGTTFRVRLPAA